MFCDNWIFDVNGEKKEELKAILNLAIYLHDLGKIEAYKIDKQRGIILYWSCCAIDDAEDMDIIKFPLSNMDLIIETIWAYLKDTKWDVKFNKWEENADHDGENHVGFRISTGDWGKIDIHGSFLLIKPSFIWFGK